MEAILNKLSDISEKAEYLNQKLNTLVEENLSLKKKVISLEEALDEKNQELQEATEQYNTIQLAQKLSGGERSSEEAEELKKRINKYIREIDQCLKLIAD